MEPSEELRSVVTRLLEAPRDGDAEAVSYRIQMVYPLAVTA